MKIIFQNWTFTTAAAAADDDENDYEFSLLRNIREGIFLRKKI
jgi:hypothetical protein